jgi:hypothetical protein
LVIKPVFKNNIMNSIIINNGKGFIKSFNIAGISIPHFGDIKDAKRFDSRDSAKAAIGNHPNCIIARDIWNIN